MFVSSLSLHLKAFPFRTSLRNSNLSILSPYSFISFYAHNKLVNFKHRRRSMLLNDAAS